MMLSKKQLQELSQETREELLMVLYSIEDELCYKCKNVTNTIEYIQDRYIGEKVNYKTRNELAINFLKGHDCLIEKKEWLLGLLEGKHNGTTY